MGDDRRSGSDRRHLVDEIDAIEHDAIEHECIEGGCIMREPGPLAPTTDAYEPGGSADPTAPRILPSGGPYKPGPDAEPVGGPFTYLDSEPTEPPPARGDTR
jgi:hypothetical protein